MLPKSSKSIVGELVKMLGVVRFIALNDIGTLNHDC